MYLHDVLQQITAALWSIVSYKRKNCVLYMKFSCLIESCDLVILAIESPMCVSRGRRVILNRLQALSSALSFWSTAIMMQEL